MVEDKENDKNCTSKTKMAGKQLIGILEPYVYGENFINYLERLEDYCELNDLTGEKYKILLLSNVIGAECSIKLRKACMPKKTPRIKIYRSD